MDMSKVNMHKRLAMTGNASDVPAKAGHFRGGGLAKRGIGKALAEGGSFSDKIGRALGRRTPDEKQKMKKFEKTLLFSTICRVYNHNLPLHLVT